MRFLLLIPIILAALFAHNAKADLDDYLGCIELNQGDCFEALVHNYDLPICDLGENSDECEINPEWSFLL
jgi:hypothetical protein